MEHRGSLFRAFQSGEYICTRDWDRAAICRVSGVPRARARPSLMLEFHNNYKVKPELPEQMLIAEWYAVPRPVPLALESVRYDTSPPY